MAATEKGRGPVAAKVEPGQLTKEAEHEESGARRSNLPMVADGESAVRPVAQEQKQEPISTGKLGNVLPFASTGKPRTETENASTGKSQLPAKMPVLANQQNASTGKLPLTDWKHNKSKPPYPRGYELSTPHGKAEIEVEYRGKKRRQLVHGYQILWRTKCADCQRKVRPVAAFFGPLALHELLKEKKDVQEGIVSFKLLRFQRKQQREADAGNRPRCRGCARQDTGSLAPYSATSATGG